MLVSVLQKVQLNQPIVGGGLFTILDGGICHGKELVNIYDSNVSPSKKLFGQGGKLRLSDIVVGTT
jgi:hypothetical protein